VKYRVNCIFFCFTRFMNAIHNLLSFLSIFPGLGNFLPFRNLILRDARVHDPSAGGSQEHLREMHSKGMVIPVSPDARSRIFNLSAS